MTRALFIHLFVLPRWFALPFAMTGVWLGLVLAPSTSLGNAALVFLMGAALMAWGHSWNSVHDWSITKLDQGDVGERSRTKPYTGGQNVIASGQVTLRAVAANSLTWLALALLLTVWLTLRGVTPWIWLPVVLGVLCAPWYSWAKLLWHPEIPLGLGFATAATWIGMAAGGEIDWLRGFLASLPLFLSFGVVAEFVDQAVDVGPNWHKGARSLGMLVAHKGWPIGLVAGLLFTATVLVHYGLVVAGVLSPWSGLAFVMIIPILIAAWWIDFMRQTWGIILGLFALMLYQVLLVMMQDLTT